MTPLNRIRMAQDFFRFAYLIGSPISFGLRVDFPAPPEVRVWGKHSLEPDDLKLDPDSFALCGTLLERLAYRLLAMELDAALGAALKGALADAGVFLCFAPRTAGGILTFGHALTEAFNLFFQCSRCIDWLRRRDKRAGLEIGFFAVSAVEPNTKLTSEFQGRQRIRMTAYGFVRRPVARLPKCVENVSGLFRNNAVIG
jgi:hypothetical protein